MSRTKDNKRVMEVETLEERCTPAVLDLRTAGAFGQVNGAIFEQVAAQPTATQVVNFRNLTFVTSETPPSAPNS